MGKKRHYYSGGNTCLGFYHFYPTMASENVERKIILKGGPGVGKSNFMREIGESFAALGYCRAKQRRLQNIYPSFFI